MYSTCTHTGTLWTTEIIPYTKTMMPTTAAGNSQAVQNPATIKSQIQCQLPDFLPSTNYGTCIVNVWANGWALSNFVTGQIFFLAVKDFSSK